MLQDHLLLMEMKFEHLAAIYHIADKYCARKHRLLYLSSLGFMIMVGAVLARNVLAKLGSHSKNADVWHSANGRPIFNRMCLRWIEDADDPHDR